MHLKIKGKPQTCNGGWEKRGWEFAQRRARTVSKQDQQIGTRVDESKPPTHPPSVNTPRSFSQNALLSLIACSFPWQIKVLVVVGSSLSTSDCTQRTPRWLQAGPETSPRWTQDGPKMSLVADRWGQHSWGRCKSKYFWQIGEKDTPWHFGQDKSRLTRIPKRSLCQKHEICSDPISAHPNCPFPMSPVPAPFAFPRDPVVRIEKRCRQWLEGGSRSAPRGLPLGSPPPSLVFVFCCFCVCVVLLLLLRIV